MVVLGAEIKIEAQPLAIMGLLIGGDGALRQDLVVTRQQIGGMGSMGRHTIFCISRCNGEVGRKGSTMCKELLSTPCGGW